jgi:hypothetical protein
VPGASFAIHQAFLLGLFQGLPLDQQALPFVAFAGAAPL